MSGQHTGRTDIPLEPVGETQAKAAGQLLKGQEFALVLASPLQRAWNTCALAGFEAQPEPDLMEWDYGAFEGLTTAEISVEYPGWSIWTSPVEGGERAADVGRRVDRVIARARQADGDTLCVAHGHLLRVLTARWLGLPPVGGRLFGLDAGAVSVLGWEHTTPVVLHWNVRESLLGD